MLPKTILAAISVQLVSMHALADTATEVMKRNYTVTKVSTVSSDTTMVLIGRDGQERQRRMKLISKLQSNEIDSKLVMRFLWPSDIKGTAFLQVEHSERDDDLWVYLPALKKSRRLVASNKKDSFAGSDFSYGDYLAPDVEQFNHRLLRMETVHGSVCYVIESVPLNNTIANEIGYARKTTWVREDNSLEVKIEYYDDDGQLFKTQVALEHKLVEPRRGRWLALRREMTNHRTLHRTTFSYTNLVVGQEMPDSAFSVRSLERE